MVDASGATEQGKEIEMIRRMLPIGTFLRKCPVCGYQITAKSPELTAHEMECLKLRPEDLAKSYANGED